MTGYPRWFLPVLLSLLAAVLLSGLGLTPTTLALRAEWEVPWQLGGGQRVWVAALHSAAAFALTALLGALWSVHMRSGWRRRRQRISGASLGSLMGALVATAVGVYYIGNDRLAATVALAHVVVGLLATGLLTWHMARGRASMANDKARRRHHHPMAKPRREQRP